MFAVNLDGLNVQANPALIQNTIFVFSVVNGI